MREAEERLIEHYKTKAIYRGMSFDDYVDVIIESDENRDATATTASDGKECEGIGRKALSRLLTLLGHPTAYDGRGSQDAQLVLSHEFAELLASLINIPAECLLGKRVRIEIKKMGGRVDAKGLVTAYPSKNVGMAKMSTSYEEGVFDFFLFVWVQPFTEPRFFMVYARDLLMRGKRNTTGKKLRSSFKFNPSSLVWTYGKGRSEQKFQVYDLGTWCNLNPSGLKNALLRYGREHYPLSM